MDRDEFLKGCGVVGVVLILAILLAFICAIPTMLLWNWLMPELFGLKTIGLLQAWGLNVLSGIWFKPTINTTKKNE